MFHQDYKLKWILLEPPIQFGSITSYHTRTQPHFGNPNRCRLFQTQEFFRHVATTDGRPLSP